MRKAHYLKPNHASETIHHAVFYDCETTPWTDDEGRTHHELEFGWAAYRRRGPQGNWLQPQWKRFTKGKDFWKWIDNLVKPKKTLYVWAHNQSFDYLASSGPRSLTSLRWLLLNAIVDSPPFIMTYKSGSRKVVMTDSLNIWLMSLEKLAKLVGLTKLTLPKKWGDQKRDDEYCRRDVEILMAAVCDWSDFLVRNDMGKMCLTVASQAMQTYRHRYLRDNILIDTDPEALQIARASYHGGRVECFYIGRRTEALYLLDLNSLYPYCMAEYEYPLALVDVKQDVSRDELRDLLYRYRCCAFITAYIRTAYLPVRHNGKLLFPTGFLRTYVSSPELEYLLEQDVLLNVHRVAIYSKGRPFKTFVGDLYEKRMDAKRNGRATESEHFKKLLNSYYGKWGQNGIKWNTVGEDSGEGIRFWRSIDVETQTVVNYRSFLGVVQRRDTEPESANSHPAIAAHVTSYGRMVLWTLTRQISPKHYLYCDTDSVLCDEVGLHQVKDMISNEVLGGLKLVGEFSEAIINGPKDYVLDGVRTLKGIREKAVEIDTNCYRQEQWVGFRRALRKGWLESPTVLMVTKTLRRTYDKGIIGNDGFVLPFHW